MCFPLLHMLLKLNVVLLYFQLAATSPVGSPGASVVSAESVPAPATEGAAQPEERTSRYES